MLILAMLPPLLGFLAAGCIAFYLCLLIPSLRRFALGASLFLATLAILVPAAFLPNIAIVGFLTEAHLHAHIPLNAIAVHHVKALALFNSVLLTAFAAILTLVHGFILRRTTFFLFRIYLAAVTFAVGVTLTWITYLVLSIMTASFILGTSAALICLALTTLSIFTFRHAQQFRAARPLRLQPITPSEYAPPAP